MNSLSKQIAESISDLIIRARSGDTESAYILLEDFAMVVKAGGIPEQVSLDYIAGCFAEIMNRVKAEKALNIPYPDSNLEKPHSVLEDIAIAEKVIWEVRKNMRETGLGQLSKAKEAIAQRMNIDASRVNEAYRTHKEAAKRIVGIRLRTPQEE